MPRVLLMLLALLALVMLGGATSGNCAMGRFGIASSPARIMNKATTQAKIGRPIKN